MTHLWLIEPDALEMIRALHARTVSVERQPIEARDQLRAYSVTGTTAKIAVRGPLLAAPDDFLDYFGIEYTVYSDIAAAIAAANASPTVSDIELDISSPGGQVDGLFSAVSAIRLSEKPMRVTSDLAASAAYALAAAAGPIKAKSPAAMFGSIGVVATYFVSNYTIDVTSTEAPNKRPDVRTEEGKAVVREQLDEIHALFVDVIAAGRGTTVETVNADYGRGRVFLAAEAMRHGMIDSMVELPPARKIQGAQSAEATPSWGAEQEKTTMNLEQLKAQHPDLYTAVLKEGGEAEASRVRAHLKLGEASGAMDVAVKAIREGKSPKDDEVHAEYIAAGMRRSELSARKEDDKAAEVAAASPVAKDQDMGDLIAARRAESAQKVKA